MTLPLPLPDWYLGLSSFENDMKVFEQLGALPMNIQLERSSEGLGIGNTIINN